MEEFVEQQSEEVEVLASIYEGDGKYKQISPTCHQYMYGEEEHKSLLVQIGWPPEYPSVLPQVTLDLFHNSYLPSAFKEEICANILQEAEGFLDCAMTYSLFDWMNGHATEYLECIPQILEENKSQFTRETKSERNDTTIEEPTSKKEKKMQLTKAQKRRVTDRTNHMGEYERGWNWVDIVKHLSQTGGD